MPSTALHLLTSTRSPEPQANRSTAPANRSIRFTSLRFHGAQSVSAVQRKRTRIGAALRFAPFAQPARPRTTRPRHHPDHPAIDPHPQRLPFAAGCGRATMLALFPPLLITNPTHTTPQALLSASLRLRSLPNSTRPSRPARSPANAVPSTALHLLTSTRPPEPQTNRSTAPANRFIRFTSLRYAFMELSR